MPCDSVPLFLSNPLLADTRSQNKSSADSRPHYLWLLSEAKLSWERMVRKRGQESRLPSKTALKKSPAKALNATVWGSYTLIFGGREAILTDGFWLLVSFRWISLLGPWGSSGRLWSSRLACRGPLNSRLRDPKESKWGVRQLEQLNTWGREESGRRRGEREGRPILASPHTSLPSSLWPPCAAILHSQNPPSFTPLRWKFLVCGPNTEIPNPSKTTHRSPHPPTHTHTPPIPDQNYPILPFP